MMPRVVRYKLSDVSFARVRQTALFGLLATLCTPRDTCQKFQSSGASCYANPPLPTFVALMLGYDGLPEMHTLRPTQKQQSIIRATLINAIGRREFNALFHSFLCGEIIDGTANVFVFNEFYALQAEALYSYDVSAAIAEAMGCTVVAVNIWPIDFSDRPMITEPTGVGKAVQT